MDLVYSKELLDILVENARRILYAGFGIGPTESTLFEIVGLLGEEPALKNYFLEKVGHTFAMRDASGAEPGTVPEELVELVAHEFRWPELQALADKRIETVFRGDASLALGDIARRITAAYDDDWEDREFYERYRR